MWVVPSKSHRFGNHLLIRSHVHMCESTHTHAHMHTSLSFPQKGSEHFPYLYILISSAQQLSEVGITIIPSPTPSPYFVTHLAALWNCLHQEAGLY